MRISRDENAGRYVIEALSNTKWDYRTADGIAKEINVSVEEVNAILSTDNRVRLSVMKSKNGKSLYTLKSKKSKVGDLFTAFRAMGSDKLGG